MAHSDAVKAAALAAYDALKSAGVEYATTEAARIVNVPRTTVSSWVSSHRPVNGHATEMRQHKRPEIVEKLDTAAHALADALSGKVPEANLQQTAVALGIVIDKRQILSGQPTQIGAYAHLTIEQRREQLAEIFERAARRLAAAEQAGQADGEADQTSSSETVDSE
jgi:hypothetical protein